MAKVSMQCKKQSSRVFMMDDLKGKLFILAAFMCALFGSISTGLEQAIYATIFVFLVLYFIFGE